MKTKINFDNLTNIENKFRAEDNIIALNLLQQMIDDILQPYDGSKSNTISLETLKDLNIVEDIPNKPIQLNS